MNFSYYLVFFFKVIDVSFTLISSLSTVQNKVGAFSDYFHPHHSFQWLNVLAVIITLYNTYQHTNFKSFSSYITCSKFHVMLPVYGV